MQEEQKDDYYDDYYDDYEDYEPIKEESKEINWKEKFKFKGILVNLKTDFKEVWGAEAKYGFALTSLVIPSDNNIY